MNNSRKAVLFFVAGISGGTATLSYRIGKTYQEDGFDIFYIYNIDNSPENKQLMIKDGFHLKKASLRDWKKLSLHYAEEYGEIILYTYTLRYMTVVDSVRKELCTKSKKVSGYLYVVLNECLISGYHLKNNHAISYRIINVLNKPYIMSLYKHNKIIFMDEGCISTTENELKTKLVDSEGKLIRLPYDTENMSEAKYKDHKIICTMSRIDFPFKSYVLGLVDIFCNFSNNYDAELWIIGNGKDFNTLTGHIQSMPDEYKERIKLFGNIDYSEVKALIRKSYVFVGMGTSLLDSVSVMIPSIPVQVHNQECMGNGFFNNNPNKLGFMKEEKGLHSISKEIYEILEMSMDDYLKLCYAEHKAFKDNYGTQCFKERISRLAISRDSLLDRLTAVPFNIAQAMLILYSFIKNKRRTE